MNRQVARQRVLNSIVKSDLDCWDWQRQVGNSGYGKTQLRDEAGDMQWVSAQHASYLAFVGPVPPGKYVDQTCNNRLCVNPDHLELVDLQG